MCKEPRFASNKLVILVALSLLAASIVLTSGSCGDPIPAPHVSATTPYSYDDPLFTTTTPTQATYSEYAMVTIWWTDAAADYSSWLHFRTVDQDGSEVMNGAGSDLVDLREPIAETSARRALVDQLRYQMEAEGWDQIGVIGEEWYEYGFAR
jgi:hypothetical protein